MTAPDRRSPMRRRIHRIRDDKPLHEADTLDTLRALMEVGPHGQHIADD